MKKKKVLITAIVTIILAIAGVFFGIEYTDKDVKKISEGIEAVVEIVDNQSTTEIPELTKEDEETLEVQETEAEGFELQGEIAYNGSGELPQIDVGEYAGLTYYSQIDSRWKDLSYTSTNNPTQTMGSSACGPTCGAMVVSSIKGNILPITMADLYVQYGFRSVNNGTYWSAFRWTADVFDIGYTETIYLNNLCDLLEQKYMAIVACGNGIFTTGGHFIVIYGFEDVNRDGQCDVGDKLKVYDPYLYNGKFNTSTRRGKATVDGNTVLVEKETFREYANYGTFFCFKNDRQETKENPTTVTVVKKEEPKIENTVGQTRKLAKNCYLFSESNLTGTRYSYLKNTKITIKENVSANIDKIYVSATRRTAYIDISNYTSSVSQVTISSARNTVGQFKRFKTTYTYIYSNSNLSGYKYTYLKNTQIKILENLGNIDRIYVPATRRYGYVLTNVYK